MKLDAKKLNTKQKLFLGKLMDVDPARTKDDMQEEFRLEKRTLNRYSKAFKDGVVKYSMGKSSIQDSTAVKAITRVSCYPKTKKGE